MCHLLTGTGRLRLLTVAILLPALAAMASTNAAWYARVWQSEDGLPSDSVTALAQTPDGYLWLATANRIARFDGNEFEQFQQTDFAAGKNQRFTAIVCGRDGSLWLPMDRGPVVHLKNGVTEIITNNVPNLVAEDAIEDGDGAIWVSYRGGTLRRIKDGVAEGFSEDSGFPGPHAGNYLARDNAGHLSLSQRGQVFRYRDDRFEPVVTLSSSATRIAGARDGGFWICSGPDFFKYDERNGLRPLGHLNLDPANMVPTAVLEAHDGTVWIGTSTAGLFHYDGSGFENVPTSHRDILCLLEDRERNLWVGTAGGGLDRLQPRVIELQGTEAGLPVDAVRSISEDPEGTVWAVTLNDLLVKRVNDTWTTVSTSTNWPGGAVTCVVGDPRGGVWIAGRSRIYHSDGQRFRSWDSGLTNHIMRALWANTNGDLWIAGERLERFHDGASTPLPLPADVETIRAMAADIAGNVWIGSINGHLLRAKGDTVSDETAGTFEKPDSIRCLTTTSDGSLWIGFANDGLGVLKNGKFSRFGVAQGLADDGISQIVPDDFGWLWLGTDHGIFKVRRQDLDAVSAGTLSRVQCIHFGRDEGLPGLQASYGVSPGAIQAHDGHLWMPLRSAIAIIDPSLLHEDLAPPPVLIKRVAVDDQTAAAYGGVMPVGKDLDLRQGRSSLRLPPGHHRLEFNFTALNLAAAENIQFRYRLVGVDEHWVDAKNRRVVDYPHLTTGHYQFLVNARKNGGVWNPADTAFAFDIRPFFWETWWFRLATLAGFTACAIGVGRYISFRRLRRKLQALEQQAALEKERTRIAKDIHDDLGGSLTEAALLLNLAYQDREQPKKVVDHVQQAATTVKHITESIDEIVWAANPRNDTVADLNDYVSLYAVRFLQAANIRCRIDSPRHLSSRALSPEIRHSLFLVAKEALNNIVRHAGADEVRLQTIATDGSLQMIISDNGRGFDGAPDQPYSDGLGNMRQRMADIGGQFVIESKPGAGTRISMTYFWPLPK